MALSKKAPECLSTLVPEKKKYKIIPAGRIAGVSV
jgi:hypothetical protein